MAFEDKFRLSSEHTEYKFMGIETMSELQQRRVNECLEYAGNVVSAKF